MTEEVLETIKEVTTEVGLPAPLECVAETIAETGFSFFYWYGEILFWFLPAVMIVGGYIVLRHLIWGSLLFNYHYYLEYGSFVLLWGDGDDIKYKERRLKLATELKIEADFASWFAALAMSGFILIMCLLTGYLWPITVIFVVPLALVRLIGYRKRKRINFTQKLKGEHLKDKK